MKRIFRMGGYDFHASPTTTISRHQRGQDVSSRVPRGKGNRVERHVDAPHSIQPEPPSDAS